MGTIDSYLEKYKKNKSNNDKYKIVVTFQIKNKKEMKAVHNTIKSLLDQTKLPDSIVCCTNLQVPEKYKKAVSVYNTDSEHISCSLKREKESDTKIIAVSPGKVYAKDLIENLCKGSDDNLNCLIKVKGSQGLDYEQGILTRPGLYEEIEDHFDVFVMSKNIYEIETEKAW